MWSRPGVARVYILRTIGVGCRDAKDRETGAGGRMNGGLHGTGHWAFLETLMAGGGEAAPVVSIGVALALNGKMRSADHAYPNHGSLWFGMLY